MPLFSLKKIGELADGRQAYLKGTSLNSSGKVLDIARLANPLFDEYLSANVEENAGRRCHVEVGLSAEGTMAYMTCDCPGFRPDSGACRHIVALLVHKYYEDMGGRTYSAAPAGKGPARSDDAARRMVETYLAREAAELVAQTSDDADKVALTPVLELLYRRPRLSFSLGTRRPYVLKDIARFCSDMASGATAEYGKLLRFVHHPSSFTEESRPLLRFLLREFEDLQAQQEILKVYGNTRLGKELPLSPGGFDRFFELYAGSCVDFRENGRVRSIRLMDENPPLTIQVHAPEEGGGLLLRTEDAGSIQGAAHFYVLHGTRLYRCAEDYASHMTEWISTIQTAQNGLFIAGDDLPAFCASVLPVIRPYIRLEGDTDGLEPYQPRALECAVYLDAPDAETITARLECRYGDDVFNPYAEGPTAPFRDRLGELKARLILQKYFTSFRPEDGRLLFHGDEEQIYRFVAGGVEDIERIAVVYATDGFKKIGLMPPPKVSVGVSLDSDLLLDFDVGGLDIDELSRVLDSYRQNKKYHRLRTGSFIQLDDNALAGLAEMADGLALTDAELRTGRIRVPKYRAMYLDKVLREQETIHYQRDSGFKSLIKNMKAVADSDYPVPAALSPVLRNYQKTGYRWLKTMETAGFGGILADDMGLGKTLQVIALLLNAREEGNDLPSLVVCPASLVLNWESEIRRFAPQLTVLPILGDAEQRAASLRRTAGYDVVVTSYDLLKRDIERYAAKEFRYHILDEAQVIKNHNTQNAKAVKAIRSRQRFALTGTPIENRLSELWSIFDFLMPGFLYPYSRFRERLESPIVKNGSRQALDRLSKMTGPFILRRLKRDVLKELPPKTESVLATTMEPEQRQLYLANAAQIKRDLARQMEEGGFQASRMTILAMLTRLRQLCCHPALCYDDYTGGSCKLDTCMELLREAAETGHKVLLFSQFTSMLAILADALDREGLSYFLLQGSTSKEKRAAMVDSFNRDGTQVFLISLKAGGTGLNLTGADIVIHYDPWWNVAAQNQATDRAYRIGQVNPVQVYRLIAKDTLEEKILLLQENKRELAESVIREETGQPALLTPELLLDILD